VYIVRSRAKYKGEKEEEEEEESGFNEAGGDE